MENTLTHRPFAALAASALAASEAPTESVRGLENVVDYTGGWRKARPVTAKDLPQLGGVVIRERNGTKLLIRVLSVTVAMNSRFSGFQGVYCDRDGKPVYVKQPRFYHAGKLAEGGFFRARVNHARTIFALPTE